MDDVEEGFARIARHQILERVRSEHDQGHQLLMIRKRLGYPGGLPDGRAAPVASDQIGPAQHRLVEPVRIPDPDLDTILGLIGADARPAIAYIDARKLRRACPQHLLGQILGQPLIGREIEIADQLALQPIVRMGAQERAIFGQPADAGAGRHLLDGPQGLLDPPEMEMLHRPLGQVLPFRDGLRRLVTLDHDHRNTALAQFDGQPHPDGAAAHDQNLRCAIDPAQANILSRPP